jgi:hypothetical protein
LHLSSSQHWLPPEAVSVSSRWSGSSTIWIGRGCEG